ncbi:zinc finger BED domain-containing protein RICESLEEPER 1-like [Prunus dulcis]|uniref:zinc finger BED domain-containing protein RICESLEEPER 1-like n=1 Tax=Prunus dulcis TaxID=3755 RepID=UPI001482699A|nr:zinc finger BED domain-containing protein RICESLEEPER 1-like [Prunus dulcis]
MCVETEKIECKGLVVMDVPTRWNSTYLMLDAALKFRKAFDRMGDDPDSSYLMYFKEDEGDDKRIEGIEGSGKGKGKSKTNKRVGPPSDEDWEKAVTFVMFLKTYDVTLKISASLHPTSHSTFHDLLAIDGEIRELYRYDVTIPIEERTAMDTLLNDMAASMKKKYDKYWGELHKVNPFLMIGVVIDPRFKLRNLKHIFEEIFENDPTCDRLVAQKTNEVKQLLMNMYEVYKPSSNNMGATSTTNESGVDRYLLDPLESIDEEFDILGWWRINGLKYPTLASIAKDVLAIPTSTIASESCFSTSGRVIDSFRSSLSPRMVEALICSQN